MHLFNVFYMVIEPLTRECDNATIAGGSDGPAPAMRSHVVYSQRLTSVSTSSVNASRGPSSNSVPVRITYT